MWPSIDNGERRKDAPLTLIYEECTVLLQQYFASDLADPDIRRYLIDLKSWAETARATEKYFQQDPWLCIVNTEVNSGNFIVNRDRGTIHLVDWEMPRWGDPSQDLCHFCSPLTTLWKTDWRMSSGKKNDFLNTYRRHIKKIKIRTCFFKADESKIVNCVSASAAAQHIEASIQWDPYPS